MAVFPKDLQLTHVAQRAAILKHVQTAPPVIMSLFATVAPNNLYWTDINRIKHYRVFARRILHGHQPKRARSHLYVKDTTDEPTEFVSNG